MIGQRIGIYRIEEQVAQGGTATVYRALQEGGGAELAFKLVERARPDYAEQRARLRHEASLSLRANHPGIVRTYSSGEIEEGCYAVQEFLHGRPLHRILRERTSPGQGLPVAEALAIAADLAEAVAHLHGLEIVHADLKPPNVMLCGTRPVICDLGLAVLEGEVRPHGALMGSPSYMAPEIAAHAPIRRPADVWALGVILFEMLAGARPFGLRGDGPHEILKAVREAPLPKAWLKDWPAEVRASIERLLERNPLARPRAAAVAAEWRAWVRAGG
ncbi:MAG: serine/threonine protein kinase [Planctomycetota bacterium]|nr:serine/threonine protein kinase [Planctomycetota bacterium]